MKVTPETKINGQNVPTVQRESKIAENCENAVLEMRVCQRSCQCENSRGKIFLFLYIDKHRCQAVESSSIDTLVVQLDKAEQCGGLVKTICWKQFVKKITSLDFTVINQSEIAQEKAEQMMFLTHDSLIPYYEELFIISV